MTTPTLTKNTTITTTIGFIIFLVGACMWAVVYAGGVEKRSDYADSVLDKRVSLLELEQEREREDIAEIKTDTKWIRDHLLQIK